MSEEQQKDTRTATQKIADLEQGLLGAYQTMGQMANDLTTCKEAIKLLGNKLDAVVKATSSGQQLTDEVLSKIMVDNNIEELKNKVTNLVAQGFLVAQDQPTDNSFLVGREQSPDGTVLNPRLQFVLAELSKPEFREKFKAAKIGDVITLEEGKMTFVLQEAYEIVTPAPALAAVPAPAEQAPVAVETAPETAPAVEVAPAIETPAT